MINPIEIIERSMQSLMDLLHPPTDHALRASFGSYRSLLSKHHTGFAVSGTLRLTRSDSFRNLLVIGSTGTGKSTTCLIPSILTLKGSLVIHDPSGELYDITAGQLSHSGYDIRVFNPARPHVSDAFNVFAYGRDAPRMHKLAHTLIHASRSSLSVEPIWDELASTLISLIARALVYKPSQYHNLHNVLHILQACSGAPETVRSFVHATGDKGLMQECDAFLKYEDKMRTSVIATAQGALKYLLDPDIAQVTATDTLDLRKLRTKPVAIFVQNKIGEGAYYKPLLSLFFETLFSVLFEQRPNDDDLDVYLLLDETSSLVCPTLPLAIANLRKYRVGMTLVVQEFAQLISLYGSHDAVTIRSNCFGKLTYGGGSPSACEELSRVLGSYTYTDTDDIKRTRPLLTADELRMLPPNKALFVAGSHMPMLLPLTPYYAQSLLRRLAAHPSPPRPSRSQTPLSTYPLIIDHSHVT